MGLFDFTKPKNKKDKVEENFQSDIKTTQEILNEEKAGIGVSEFAAKLITTEIVFQVGF